ncbi:MAG: C39 family peptidase [Omnitrophica WOR_2 bacterium]
MHKNPVASTLLTLAGIALITIIIYNLPPVHTRMSWRVDLTLTYLRGVIQPAGSMPTPIPQPTDPPEPTATATLVPTPTPTRPGPTATPLPTPTPIPGSVQLPAPAYEKQGPNECGPTTLAIYLHYYGWKGTKDDVSAVVKPDEKDRNVNVEELTYFARTHAGWLMTEFRVGGDIQRIKSLLAGGFPVMIEESFYDDKPYWPNDDLWAAHYLLLTGYDDASQTFTAQDSFRGPDQHVSYAKTDEYWKVFNRVYILIYMPDQEETLKSILGADWDIDANRQHALDAAQAETQADPKNAFAWFNLGTNLVYFERYGEAAKAYDTARTIGLPQRMLRYQFGPFIAYFHSARTDDLMAVTEYVLNNTPNSEEALLWHGWGLYRRGDKNGAIENFRAALKANPNYQDAKYALNFLGVSP